MGKLLVVCILFGIFNDNDKIGNEILFGLFILYGDKLNKIFFVNVGDIVGFVKFDCV